MNIRNLIIGGLITLIGGVAGADEPFKRTILQRADVNATQESVMGTGELAPGAVIDSHSHFGIEMTYIQEGEVEVTVEGEAPRRLKAGDAFTIPAGKVHSARNVAPGVSKMLGVWVFEKGKPLATPAK
jgi:quercetin dioxygenase-like cupin family protein